MMMCFAAHQRSRVFEYWTIHSMISCPELPLLKSVSSNARARKHSVKEKKWREERGRKSWGSTPVSGSPISTSFHFRRNVKLLSFGTDEATNEEPVVVKKAIVRPDCTFPPAVSIALSSPAAPFTLVVELPQSAIPDFTTQPSQSVQPKPTPSRTAKETKVSCFFTRHQVTFNKWMIQSETVPTKEERDITKIRERHAQEQAAGR